MMGPYDRYEWSDGAPINGHYILIGAPMSLHLYLMTGPTLWAHMFVFAAYEVSWKVFGHVGASMMMIFCLEKGISFV